MVGVVAEGFTFTDPNRIATINATIDSTAFSCLTCRHSRHRYTCTARDRSTVLFLLLSLTLLAVPVDITIFAWVSFASIKTSTSSNYNLAPRYIIDYPVHRRVGIGLSNNDYTKNSNNIAVVSPVATVSGPMKQPSFDCYNDNIDDGTVPLEEEAATTAATTTIIPQPLINNGDTKNESVSFSKSESINGDFQCESSSIAKEEEVNIETPVAIIDDDSINNTISKQRGAVKVVVYGIRHGRSLSNEWMNGENEWGTATYNDRNNIRDSPLSEHGINQAKDLYQQLHKEITDMTKHNSNGNNDHWMCHIDLIVVSPLTRCLQTYQYAIEPLLPVISSMASLQPQYQEYKHQKLLRPFVHPLLAERLYSVSEMGRSVLELQSEFPNMDWSYFGKDPNDIWWYDPTIATPYNTIRPSRTDDDVKMHDNTKDVLQIEEYKEWRPYGEGQFYMCAGEPDIVFQRRMEALRLWINDKVCEDIPPVQPSRTSIPSTKPRILNVLTIGHWGVYKYFTNGMEMENCQICTVEL